MFKHAAIAAAVAVAFVATPASAATVVYETGTNIVLTFNPTTNDWDGSFRFRAINTTPGAPNGNFQADYTFISPITGLGSATAGNVIVSGNLGSDLNFSQAFLNGVAGIALNFGSASTAWIFDAPVTPGLNTLTFTGIVNPNGDQTGNALATGSLTIAASVPEPMTWALFILGFGAVGSVMRRRSADVRIAKASLNFA